jgi:hypothetical protein
MPRTYHRPDAQQEQVIATFGQARLIKLADRTYELVGGSQSDRAAAGKWIAQFMRNDVVRGFAEEGSNQ